MLRTAFERQIAALRITSGSEEMLREQYKTLTRLIPFLYTVCIVVSLTLTVSFSDDAPRWLSKYLPAVLAVVMIFRRRHWMKAREMADTAAPSIMIKEMRGTAILGPLLSGGFTFIGLALMQYSDHFEQSLCILSIWVTAIASAFCLAALPIASIMVVVATAVPMILAFLTIGGKTYLLLAAVFTIVSGMLIMMLRESFQRFTDIIVSRTVINEKQKQTEMARQAVTVMAYTDSLTDLPNRRNFEKMLHDRVNGDAKGEARFAVGMLDLDGFKPINDVYGHGVGDEVLIQVAARLRAALAGKGEIARVGGDEFALIADGVSTHAAVHELSRTLRAALADPIMVGSISARLGCSAGFSLYPQSGKDPSRLIDRADMALYRAKATERGSAEIFDASLESTALERAMIEQDLRAAISENTLHVHFQPIIGLSDGRLTGFEALARWRHPKLGNISPATFVPIAEQIGIVELMTDGLLRKAATIAATWPAHLTLAFNLSADQLVKPSAGLRIVKILAEAGLPPQRFEAEVTETAIMKDVVAARRTIEVLKGAGARVSLDDFGTGYSSLSQIKDLPLDKIKIDKSFVDQICTDDKISNIVRSIINMCECLDLTCVAEGIEESGQFELLKKEGCEHGQGYLFSQPVSPEAAAKIIRRHATSDPAHVAPRRRSAEVVAFARAG